MQRNSVQIDKLGRTNSFINRIKLKLKGMLLVFITTMIWNRGDAIGLGQVTGSEKRE